MVILFREVDGAVKQSISVQIEETMNIMASKEGASMSGPTRGITGSATNWGPDREHALINEKLKCTA